MIYIEGGKKIGFQGHKGHVMIRSYVDLPNNRMHHNGPGVVEVTYDGPPGLIG